MLRAFFITFSFIVGLFSSQSLLAEGAGAGITVTPETDLGRIVVRITSTDPNTAWIASAHEDHIRDLLSQSPRLRTIADESLRLDECEDFACERQRLNAAGVDLFLEGELDGKQLDLLVIVPETEIELSQQTISLKPGTTPESVKSSILHALKPFTESGGILDQRSALRRAQKAETEKVAPTEAKQGLALGLAAVTFTVLALIALALVVFPRGRRPLLGLCLLWLIFALGPLWFISEDLALIKPVAIFAVPQPWLLAVLGGLGSGGALWAIGICILPQLRGLEFMKQDRMPFLINALTMVIAYRTLALLSWGAVAAGIIIATQFTYDLDAVHTVAVGLLTIGGLTTLGALIFEVLAQRLDRRLVFGEPSADNSWHIRVMEGLHEHPRLVGLRDLLDRTLILPTNGEHTLAYGGGFLSSPRILIPRRALEKAFETAPEEEGAPYDFLLGLILEGIARISLRSHLDATLRLSFVRPATRNRYRKASHGRPASGGFLAPYTQARQQLEGAFLAVHEGLAPFIQYLYWRHKPHTGLLTVRATRTQLNEAIKTISDELSSGRFPLTIERPRDHIIWLVQTYLRQKPAEAKPKNPQRKMRPRKVFILALLGIFTGYQLLSAALYHPVYVERIALQQAKIDAKKAKKEDLQNVPEPQSPPADSTAIVATQPETSAPSPRSEKVVEKSAPTKSRAKPKTKPKAKKKPKGKQKQRGKSKQRDKKPLPAAKKPGAERKKL